MNGVISWFAKNSVAANLLVAFIILAGLYSLKNLKREVFPEVDSDMISVSVDYLGAAPSEVEEGICVRVEEAIQSVDGIKKISSVAREGIGVITAELLPGSDPSRLLDDIKARVDAIDTFPEEAEKPVVQEILIRKQVVSVAIAGDVDDATLRRYGERVRDDLSAFPGITQVELENVRPYEIAIEVSQHALRKYGLSFDEVAMAVKQTSLDMPGGSVKTEGGEILLRTKGQAYLGGDFASLVIRTRADGTRLTIGDVAKVKDGFAETDQEARFDGMNSVLVQVFRVGEQNAITISESVSAYVESAKSRLPERISMTIWQDDSTYLSGRQELLLKNGMAGLFLVFITLALFLRLDLALWVSFGLAVSFLGTLWVMPGVDVSINMLSLFAFILVLGIVVDDAIVVSENIHTHQEKHEGSLLASIRGAQEVSKPVIFAVLTTVVAFFPLLMVPGNTGKIMRVIPLVVIPTLLFSLVESLLVLPSHLSHSAVVGGNAKREGRWKRFQQKFSGFLDWFITNVYQRALDVALTYRYGTLAVSFSILMLTFGLVAGGWIKFVFFPPVEGDNVAAILTMPLGTPVDATRRAVSQIEAGAMRLKKEVEAQTPDGTPAVFRHILSSIGTQPYFTSQQQGAGKYVPEYSSAYLGEVHIELSPSENREGISSEDLADRWREITGPIPSAVELNFTASIFSSGEPINVQLSGANVDELRLASEELKEHLRTYAGVMDISDNFREGKQEVKMGIKSAAEAVGLTMSDLGRQVRQAFYGEEAQRIQRGRDEVKVMVRYPPDERRSMADLEEMRIRTPSGVEVPFREVAEIEQGRGYATINRVDRRRAINVTADVDSKVGNSGEIIAKLDAEFLPQLKARYPRINYAWEGERREQRETMSGILAGYPMAMVIIYALLAIPFRSYLQPFIVMSAIPFGLVGAVLGHLLMGMELTILSMFGLVALSGVVVNDNLVLVVFINRFRDEGGSLFDAVKKAGAARFRPIILTSLTTFMGLMPLILEKSVQALFLIPMAISLAFGVMFATIISLLLVPASYLILEDAKGLFARFTGREHGGGAMVSGTEDFA